MPMLRTIWFWPPGGRLIDAKDAVDGLHWQLAKRHVALTRDEQQ